MPPKHHVRISSDEHGTIAAIRLNQVKDLIPKIRRNWDETLNRYRLVRSHTHIKTGAQPRGWFTREPSSKQVDGEDEERSQDEEGSSDDEDQQNVGFGTFKGDQGSSSAGKEEAQPLDGQQATNTKGEEGGSSDDEDEQNVVLKGDDKCNELSTTRSRSATESSSILPGICTISLRHCAGCCAKF